MPTNKRGTDLLWDPSLNKSTAFTEAEKQALGIVGLVPDVTESMDVQLNRVRMQLGAKTTDLERYTYCMSSEHFGPRAGNLREYLAHLI